VGLRPAPSRLAETLVGWLIPPASREHVVGDLHERYRAPLQYFWEATLTVPMVVASRIRRTTDPGVFLMEALAVYASFLVAAWWQLGVAFLTSENGLVRLSAPTAAALAAVVLAVAYADPQKRWALQPLHQAVLGVGCAFLWEGLVGFAWPEWHVPLGIMIGGGGMSILLLSALRMLFPPDEQKPRGAS